MPATRASIVTERGTSFGYHNLVVDMRAFPMMRAQGVPVVFDVTHSLQLPGGGDGVTAGQAEYIEPLASAGVAAGVDGVFLEVHEEPARAKSDAQNALRLDRLEPLLRRLMAIDAIAKQRGGAPAWLTARRLIRGWRRWRARARAQGARNRSGGDPRAGRPPRRAVRRRRAAAAQLQGARHPHRHGQVGHHLPQDRRDADQHRHAVVLPAPGRSDSRRPRRHPERRRRRGAVVQRRDRRDCCGCSKRSAGSARS